MIRLIYIKTNKRKMEFQKFNFYGSFKIYSD